MHSKEAALYYDYFARTVDLPFFRRMMLRFGGPVLVLGCGTGELAIDLAGAGLEVIGVDSSRYMLDVARDKMDNQSPSLRQRLDFVEADIQDYVPARQFGSVIAPANSLARILDAQGQLDCLENMRNVLAVGGKLVLDLVPPTAELIQGGSKVSSPVVVDGDITLLRTIHGRSNLNNQSYVYTIIYEQYKGGVLRHKVIAESSTSLLFPREVMLLLRTSGFSVEEVFGDSTGSEFSSTSRRMIVVAAKQ